MEDQADLDKKYTTGVNARLVKLAGVVKVKKGFSVQTGSNVQSAVAYDGKEKLVATTVLLLTTRAKRGMRVQADGRFCRYLRQRGTL